MKITRSIFLFLFFISFHLLLKAQAPATDTSGKKKITIINAERLNYQKKDSTEFQSAAGKVIMKQETTLFYCDSVVLNKTINVLEAFGHVHINDNDSVNTYSDYLQYFGAQKKAYLNGNVKLTDGKGVLTTPDLNYDLNTHIGIYTKTGKVVSDKTVLTSQEGYYYGETRDVYFKKNVVLVNPDYHVTTDTLLFNTYTNIATFVVPTLIQDSSKRKILTSGGYYDMHNKKAHFTQRPHIVDSSTTLDADEVASIDSIKQSEANGNVVYRDTAQGVSVFSNNLKSDGIKSSFLATQKPIMVIKQDKDSIYMAADTFFSAKLSSLIKFRKVPVIVDSLVSDSIHVYDSVTAKNDSAKDRFFEAYYNVKIYSDSLQAVGDSLFYSSEDSAFRLFKSPVVWSQQSQLTGDTIYLFTKDKKPKRMYAFENAFSVQKVGPDFYNQVKGRVMNAYFLNGEIDSVRTKGNAESIYYGQDDSSKFIGMNQATADAIDMYFANREAQKVVFRSNVQGVTTPMRQIDVDDMRLRGFKWLDDRRPKTKYDLFGN